MLQAYIQPSIEVLNIRIDEPVTTATDILLATLCFYAFAKIRQLESKGRIKWCLKYYFLTLGLGALFGGILGHGFLYNLNPYWKLVSWIFILLSVALIAHALLELAKPLIRPGFVKLIFRFNMLVLALALFFTIWTLAFSPVKYFTIYGLLIVVGSLSIYIFLKTGSRGIVRFLIATGLSIIPALVFSFEWGFSPWFNHNDISHVILAGIAFLFYRGSIMILLPLET